MTVQDEIAAIEERLRLADAVMLSQDGSSIAKCTARLRRAEFRRAGVRHGAAVPYTQDVLHRLVAGCVAE